MEWFEILYVPLAIILGWSIPWAILQISDGTFLLEQIFRILYWGAVLISFELTDWHWIFCLISGFVPGAIIWGCYDHWFDDSDEFQTLDDDFEIGISIESLPKSDSLIVLPNPEILSPQVG